MRQVIDDAIFASSSSVEDVGTLAESFKQGHSGLSKGHHLSSSNRHHVA